MELTVQVVPFPAPMLFLAGVEQRPGSRDIPCLPLGPGQGRLVQIGDPLQFILGLLLAAPGLLLTAQRDAKFAREAVRPALRRRRTLPLPLGLLPQPQRRLRPRPAAAPPEPGRTPPPASAAAASSSRSAASPYRPGLDGSPARNRPRSSARSAAVA